ncbi:hypothetical protein SARC_05785 [Sphaeroforma arctica JP610]|uniref:Pectin acetylesterase n=1 Tax=Sphaeroforma arctica JP610 TaxID=667725 RepID=A0A0L0FZC4_9EUKA|nr:hypothetical protein SARC_05785 [Sphaeroforma arctica JP610]KNC81911.1 hypothetical protein SARC_05785 [Sphaeroforma arctica JP610]|eukprot:XP_014155813.1 hypothetical protein SARC_05785 [Sphaeroforma arctica JP610]
MLRSLSAVALVVSQVADAASARADPKQELHEFLQTVQDMVVPNPTHAPIPGARADIYTLAGVIGVNTTDRLLDVQPVPIDMYTDFAVCDINLAAGQDCNMTYLRANQGASKGWIVRPDPTETKAICNDGTPFAFQVFPGTTDNVLFWFQGGGGCFNYEMCRAVPVATINFRPEDSGIFDFSNSENPVVKGGWSIIVNNYCSGDLFLGNATIVTNGSDSEGGDSTIHFRGALNTLEVFGYYDRHLQRLDETNSSSHRLSVSGCSAGSLGAQLWNDYMVQNYRAERTLLDSYIGMIPEQFGVFVQVMGWCKVGEDILGWTEELLALCNAGGLYNFESYVYGPFLQNHVGYPLGYLGSFDDATQKLFYVLTSSDDYESGITSFAPAFGESQKFTSTLFGILDNYTAINPASTYYLVDSAMHCFLPEDYLYNETLTAAPHGDNQSMLEYIDAFLNVAVTPQYTEEDKL